MIQPDFIVYWRVSPNHIQHSQEAYTLIKAKHFRQALREAGYDVHIEVRGNDY